MRNKVWWLMPVYNDMSLNKQTHDKLYTEYKVIIKCVVNLEVCIKSLNVAGFERKGSKAK